MKNSNNMSKVITALLLGAGIGATIGILYAPDKGTNTRKKIIGKANHLSDELNEKFNQLLVDAQNEIEMINNNQHKS